MQQIPLGEVVHIQLYLQNNYYVKPAHSTMLFTAHLYAAKLQNNRCTSSTPFTAKPIDDSIITRIYIQSFLSDQIRYLKLYSISSRHCRNSICAFEIVQFCPVISNQDPFDLALLQIRPAWFYSKEKLQKKNLLFVKVIELVCRWKDLFEI